MDELFIHLKNKHSYPADPPVCDNNCPPVLAGPRALGHVFKYHRLLGAKGGRGEGERTCTVHKKNMLYQQQLGPGLKRNPTQDVAENEQNTGTEMANVR